MKKSKILYESDESETDDDKVEVQNIITQEPPQEPVKITPEKKENEPEEKKGGDWLEFVEDDLEHKKTKAVPKFVCEFCQDKFVRKYFLERHITENRCKKKREMDNKILEEAKELLAKKKKKELDKVRPKRKYVKKQQIEKVEEEEEEIKPPTPPPPPPKPTPPPQKPIPQKPIQQPIPQKPKFIIRF